MMHSILIGRIQANLKNGIANPFQVEIRVHTRSLQITVYTVQKQPWHTIFMYVDLTI